MHARKTLALALAALAVTGGSTALAEVKASDDRRGDAKCESHPCPDLKSAVANPGIFDKTQLLYIVTQHNAVQKTRLPRIAIKTSGSSTSAPDYYVEKRGRRSGVFDAKTGSRVGAAVLGSHSSKSLTWTFSSRAIGSPQSYLWRVEIVAKDGSRIDMTPNRGYLRHSVG
jgi:hypothetical protein